MKRIVISIGLVLLLSLALLPFGLAEGGIVHQDVELESQSGVTLRGYLEGPEAALRGTDKCPLIILFHGLMDSGEFALIRKQADAYTARGYAVLAVDFNGHGKSDGKLIDMTLSKELQDGEAILEYAGQLPFVSETILIGHSQGGLVASILAGKYPEAIDKLVLLAPGGFIPDSFRRGDFFGTKGDPNDPPEKVEIFGDYVGREYFLDAMQYDPYTLAAAYQNRVVLIVTAEQDSASINEEAVPKYAQVYTEGGNDVCLKAIAGAPHDFEGHENEVSAAVLETLDEK